MWNCLGTRKKFLQVFLSFARLIMVFLMFLFNYFSTERYFLVLKQSRILHITKEKRFVQK